VTSPVDMCSISPFLRAEAGAPPAADGSVSSGQTGFH
jgi:hypothetical protein